jgi:hypothetical protein
VTRGQLMLHELFHRVQPQLGLQVSAGDNDHLDTLDGRYWLQLEWRALLRALRTTGADRAAATRDALAFRAARRGMFPEGAEKERADEIREGLAQYTGVLAAAATPAEAVSAGIRALSEADQQPSFTKTFAYTSGVGYGLLLDASSPGWTRQVTGRSDLGQMLTAAAAVDPAANATAASPRYDGATLRAAEEKRDLAQQMRIAELRRRFVDGPVLVVPRGRNATLITTGATPIPGTGMMYVEYRVSHEWGSLEAARGMVMSTDGERLIVSGPSAIDASTLTGDGWKVTVAPGWVARPGPRPGDFVVVKQ